MFEKHHNQLILNVNFLGVAMSYGLLGLSLWLSTDIPLATKGYWAMGIFLLTLSLVNVVKYRFDMRLDEDRLKRIEDARNEKMLEEAIKEAA
ncbi:hypothetical protein [Gymnodinialimonas hymeniacidonis]|uniref:hypothetical protein n=1 Tax=Gymnodinialimonas hymeniacidonis TaxID=3126508 RepID=UPI0034C5EDEA